MKKSYVPAPQCPNPDCSGKRFALTQVIPEGGSIEISLVHCASCGTVVGTLDSHSAAYLVKDLATKLGYPV